MGYELTIEDRRAIIRGVTALVMCCADITRALQFDPPAVDAAIDATSDLCDLLQRDSAVRAATGERETDCEEKSP